jgi:hypothetical protein
MSRGSGPRDRGYSIPREDLIKGIIHRIMDGNVTVSSQRRFHSLIMKELEKTDGDVDYRLSPKRLRRIASSMDSVDLIIHCREGKRRYRGKNCPVCGAPLDSIKNSTLYGWTVSTGKVCDRCGYWTGKRRRIPIRYVFTTEKESYVKRKGGDRG